MPSPFRSNLCINFRISRSCNSKPILFNACWNSRRSINPFLSRSISANIWPKPLQFRFMAEIRLNSLWNSTSISYRSLLLLLLFLLDEIPKHFTKFLYFILPCLCPGNDWIIWETSFLLILIFNLYKPLWNSFSSISPLRSRSKCSNTSNKSKPLSTARWINNFNLFIGSESKKAS